MSLLHMSLYGAVIILTVVLIRTLTLHKLPKKIFLILWGIALLRLLVPFEIPSVYSLYSLLPAQQTESTLQQAQVADFFETPDSSTLPAYLHTEKDFVPNAPVFTAPEEPENSFIKTAMPYIWCTGTVLFVLYFAISYIRCHRGFCTSLPVCDGYIHNWLEKHPLHRTISVRQSDLISTPLTYGVIRPVILLPKTMDINNREQLDYVLLHELTHIRRFDQVAKLCMLATLCLHWFNPLVWVMYLLFNRDLELSCDESVLHQSKEERSAYAMTLIHMEETRSHTTPLFSHFSQNALEERIVAIMKMQKLTLGAALFSIILVLAVVLTLTTSAKAAEPKLDSEKHPVPNVTCTPSPTPVPTATPSPVPDPGPTATPPPFIYPTNGSYTAIVKGCMENTLMLDFVDYDASTGEVTNPEVLIVHYPVAEDAKILLLNFDARLDDPEDDNLITNDLSAFISSVYTESGWSKMPYFFAIRDGVITIIEERLIP